jgi:putative salt-induced outer membrane protein
MESTQTLYLTLKDGQIVVGKVTTEDGKFRVATSETGEIQVTRDSVVAVRSEQQQKTSDAELERLRNPRLGDYWSGIVDSGLSLTRGNSATTTYNFSAKAARVTKRDKISAYTNVIFAKDDTTPPSRTTAHAVRGGVRVDVNATERLFGFGLSDFEYDEFQNLDLRNTLGGGFGYYPIKNKTAQFDVFGGITFLQEFFSVPLDPTIPTSTTRKSGEGVAGEELATSFGGQRLTLDERFSVYPNITNTGQYRFTLDTTLATKIVGHLSWQATASDRYVSAPVPGKKKNDLLLSTGFRWTFGKGVF